MRKNERNFQNFEEFYPSYSMIIPFNPARNYLDSQKVELYQSNVIRYSEKEFFFNRYVIVIISDK